MLTCQKCQNTFPFIVKINGKRKNLSGRKFCLVCSPFGERNTSDLNCPRPSTIDRLNNVEFENLIKNSTSRADVMRKLKMRKSGGSFTILNRRIQKENIDISHFKMGNQTGNRKIPLERILVKNSTYRNTHHLKLRLISEGILIHECKECQMKPIWNNKPISFHLDHINGNETDNRIENLRLLCPNCHSQTETYCGRKK